MLTTLTSPLKVNMVMSMITEMMQIIMMTITTGENDRHDILFIINDEKVMDAMI